MVSSEGLESSDDLRSSGALQKVLFLRAKRRVLSLLSESGKRRQSQLSLLEGWTQIAAARRKLSS